MRETLRDPIHTGKGGRPRLRPWRQVVIAQVVKRDARRRVVATERRLLDGTPARVETLRRRAQGDGVIHTASMERLHATCRECLAPLARRCRALARPTLTLPRGCAWWARSRTLARRIRVCLIRYRRRPPWRRGSPTMAGRCTHCCRFLCRCPAGYLRSSASVLRGHCNA